MSKIIFCEGKEISGKGVLAVTAGVKDVVTDEMLEGWIFYSKTLCVWRYRKIEISKHHFLRKS
jgi:hypothetical protein